MTIRMKIPSFMDGIRLSVFFWIFPERGGGGAGLGQQGRGESWQDRGGDGAERGADGTVDGNTEGARMDK